MKVTKDMTIGELLMADRGAGMILMQNGMGCVGCPASARVLAALPPQAKHWRKHPWYTAWTAISWLQS